jgi:starch phosphorylase
VPIRWIEMVRHTLKSLGPKVLATRMVRDYVHELYTPSAASSRALNHGHDRARELARWKHRVAEGWPDVAIDHVESSGVGDAPEIGQTLRVTVYVSLGALRPEDVDVQVVHGRIRHDDELVDTHVESLELAESYEAGRHRYEGSMELKQAGPFGYTARVVPQHELLASPAELGFVIAPAD